MNNIAAMTIINALPLVRQLEPDMQNQCLDGQQCKE